MAREIILKHVQSIIRNDARVRAAAISYALPVLLITASALFFDAVTALLAAIAVSLFGVLMRTNLRYYRYSAQACLLGVVSGCSIFVIMTCSDIQRLLFARYTLVLSVFHFTEMFITGLTNVESLTVESFLLNHSFGYWAAAISSWLEYGIETALLPNIKSNTISWLGIAFCASGELLRKAAMWQANTSFTHRIALRKKESHTLVTNGVYGWVRHPGYVGWFLWSVGTQLILCNPICLVGYTYVTFLFFQDRIYEEERYLFEFYGHRYVAYQADVALGIPLIAGFSPSTPVMS